MKKYDKIVAQSAQDYDIDIERAQEIYEICDNHNDFYEKLEEFIKFRANQH